MEKTNENLVSSKKIRIGENPCIDEGTTIGYKPERDINDLSLFIGNNCSIRLGSIIYAGSKIGDNFKTGHNVVIREENVIGNNLQIWTNSYIDYGCIIGNNVKIHCNVYIAQYTTIEDEVFIAPGVSIANDIHPGCKFSEECMRGPTIKRGARICVNVSILPYITIGENSVIGSGSVVTKDVLPNTVSYGNPAKTICSIHDLKCNTGFTKKPYI